MSVSVKIDTVPFENAMRKIASRSSESFQKVLKKQGRLFCERVVKFSPPKNLAQGRKAVAGDVYKVFRGSGQWDNKTIEKAIKSGDVAWIEEIFQNIDELKGVKAVQSPDYFEHQRRRGSRGRVRGKTPSAVVLRESNLKKYIARIQRRVGLLKAGWCVAWRRLGGRVPSWIDRHGNKYGSLNLRLGDKNKPSIEIVNRARSVVPFDQRTRVVQNALDARARDMIKSLDFEIKKNARSAGIAVR